ncbi:MAG: hypothetical protein ACLP52_04320 [Streptosporangiaceae bacterium]
MTRLLILGDPVVSLGRHALIPDGALIVQDATIVAAGPREQLARLGPFDRVLGSPDHFLLPGFVNCHYHSELALGPGLYQYVFEKASMHIQAAAGDIDEEDLYYAILWGLIGAIKGGQAGTVDMYYGRWMWLCASMTGPLTAATGESVPLIRLMLGPGRRRCQGWRYPSGRACPQTATKII